MAKTVTVSTIITDARRRADMENHTLFISDAEALAYVNESYAELYDMLTSEFGEEYNLSSSNISSISGTDSYALPSDFYILRLVEVYINDDWYDVDRFKLSERTCLDSTTAGIADYYYSLQGSNIVFLPTPTTPLTFRIWYVPVYSTLLAGGSVDGVNGWENYIKVDVARKMLAKEESDTSELEKEKQQIIARIKRMAKNRDSGRPRRIRDVRRSFNNDLIPRMRGG